MQSDQQLFPHNPLPPLSNQVGGNYVQNIPNASAFGGTVLPTGVGHSNFHGVEFQPSEVCPKNFIIFDQTEKRSQIMFHPAITPKFCYPGLNLHSSYIHDNVERGANIEKELPSTHGGEDSDDIDALLSLEEEEEDECDEEEVSTARTHGYASDSSDSCSSYGSRHKKSRPSSFQKTCGSGSSQNCERKRQKMRKMVRALRRIVPGGNQLNTVAVLDETVRYLKSLKVEMHKLGVGNLKE